MIRVEDSNNEAYHINPEQVVYVKERVMSTGKQFKILLSTGEVVMTQNERGARMIIKCMLVRCQIDELDMLTG